MDTKDPKQITIHDTFSQLFPIRPELLELITADMQERWYDFSQPIILATWSGQNEPVCIDGHTRLKAAVQAGLDQVPVFTHEFETEDEAIEHCIYLQRRRRNMTDAEILACIKVLDRRTKAGRPKKELAQDCANLSEGSSSDNGTEGDRTSPRKPQGKSAHELADLLGTSTRKIEQGRTVIDHGDTETLTAVDQGKMSINKGYNNTQTRRRQEKGGKKKDTSCKAKVTVPESNPDTPGADVTGEQPMEPDATPEAASVPTDQRAHEPISLSEVRHLFCIEHEALRWAEDNKIPRAKDAKGNPMTNDAGEPMFHPLCTEIADIAGYVSYMLETYHDFDIQQETDIDEREVQVAFAVDLLSSFYGYLADEHACGSELWASIQEKRNILRRLNTDVLVRLEEGDYYHEDIDPEDCECGESELE